MSKKGVHSVSVSKYIQGYYIAYMVQKFKVCKFGPLTKVYFVSGIYLIKDLFG